MNDVRRALRGMRPGLCAPRITALLMMAVVALPISSCRKGGSGEQAPAAETKAAPESEGVTLTPEELEKSGIKTVTLAATSHAPETTGYAVVIAREALAQAVADLTSAAAVERQSSGILARDRGLAGTPGAMPVEALESAERQATVDHAALMLAVRRLAATYGQNAPWKDNYNSPILGSLARGETLLARVTFPLGALGPALPAKLRLSHLGNAQDSRHIESTTVWRAPADATIPGQSFFAILKGGEASEGERLLAHSAVGAAESGVVVPFSAAVISAGKYWAYVEEKPGVFVRTPIDPGMPTDDGYFVREGIAPGAQVVVASAGLLLAHETNPSTGPAD
jgi:hypothetical protein